MKAIILAAGYGNRMRPLTQTTHKTLLEVGGKTIIGRIIDGLCDNGITDIVIVTGYMRNQLIKFLTTNYPDINFSFINNSRYTQTNNIYSMALAFEAIDIDDDIILIESDLVYDPSVIKRIVTSKYPNVALVDKFKSGMDGTVVTLAGEVISNIIPPHLQGSDFDFSDKYKTLNIYKFSKDFCNTVFERLLTYYARVIDDNCYYELILGILTYMQRETIYAEVLDGEKWAEIDDPNDLRVAEFVLDDKKRRVILESAFGGYWSHEVLDFYFIRNMYFPTRSMLAEMRNNLPALLYNYGSKQNVLNQKLAYYLLYKRENLNVLNGASQIYPITKSYFAGQKGLIPAPTFGEYARVFEINDVYFDRVGINTVEIEAKSRSCDVVVFVNPNNPTGSVLQTDWIYKFAADNTNKTIVVDESFIEFSGFESIITLLEEQPLDNVIVIKSLSKSLGVPGLRLGYVYSYNQKFNECVRDKIPIWNLNSVAEYMLEIILKHRQALAQSYLDTVRDREAFSSALSELSFVEKVYSSGANFLLVSLKKDSVDYPDIGDRMLSEHSIYIKNVSGQFLDGKTFIRLAVRLPEENSRLIECLSDCVATLRAGLDNYKK
ncbi:MAG: class I and II aminotransferase [Anaerolineae bacterium]|nr:class I and II aminotransferase [Anaerolineae bacterium]